VALPYRATKSIFKPPVGFRDLRHPVYNGCIAAYLLNEGGGPVIWDLAQQQRVSITGTFNWSSSQLRHGTAINFNGGKGVGTTFKMDPLSIALWVNVSTLSPANQVPLSKTDNGSSNGWYVTIRNTNDIQFNFCNAAGVFRCDSPLTFSTGWHFVVFTWDQTGSASASSSAMYIDGTAVSPPRNASVGALHSDSGIALTVGTFEDGSSAMSNGMIGSFFLWNRIIGAQEQLDLYLATYPSIQPRYVLGAPPPAETFAATASTKAATLGRKIFATLTAAKHTFAGVLTTQLTQFKTLTATAAQKAGVLLAFKAIGQTLTAGMLQRSSTLGREVFKTLAATKATFAGALTAIKAASQKTFAATKATFAGALSFNVSVKFTAIKASYQGKLTLAVQHGPQPPSVCTPTACTTVSNVISHVEICENPGS